MCQTTRRTTKGSCDVNGAYSSAPFVCGPSDLLLLPGMPVAVLNDVVLWVHGFSTAHLSCCSPSCACVQVTAGCDGGAAARCS